jgi:hypothetical protein
MHSFFFGERQRQLYGAYHPAVGFSTTAAVICPPWGHEYLEGHSTVRRLADLLSQQGVHALRFDYLGTGDSSGETTVTTVSSMARDVEAAVDEALALSGASDCLLIGLRLGAHAVQISCQGLPEVLGTILWDPIVDGAQYVKELGGTGREDPDGNVDFGGYLVAAGMVGELEALTLGEADSAPGHDLRHVLVGDAETAHTCQERGWSVATYDEEMPWRGHSDFGSTALPARTLNAIVEIASGA